MNIDFIKEPTEAHIECAEDLKNVIAVEDNLFDRLPDEGAKVLELFQEYPHTASGLIRQLKENFVVVNMRYGSVLELCSTYGIEVNDPWTIFETNDD